MTSNSMFEKSLMFEIKVIIVTAKPVSAVDCMLGFAPNISTLLVTLFSTLNES